MGPGSFAPAFNATDSMTLAACKYNGAKNTSIKLNGSERERAIKLVQSHPHSSLAYGQKKIGYRLK